MHPPLKDIIYHPNKFLPQTHRLSYGRENTGPPWQSLQGRRPGSQCARQRMEMPAYV